MDLCPQGAQQGDDGLFNPFCTLARRAIRDNRDLPSVRETSARTVVAANDGIQFPVTDG